jgi:putative oxidoreductase
MDIGLLLLRLVVGLTLAAHGAQKLFGWFGGPGLDGTGQFFAMLGFPPGRRHALMAGLAESGGGLSLALGFLTPAAVAIVISVMFVAAMSVHVKKGFFLTNGGYEYTLVLSIAALAVAFTGPGSLSVDALVGCAVSGDLCGFAALLVGVVFGALALMQRRSPGAVKTAEQPLKEASR